MKNTKIIVWILLYFLFSEFSYAENLKTIYRQPMADFIANIKASGHKRIAQGIDVYIGKDPKTGEVFSGRTPVMLTKNENTGEWTVSVLHNKVEGGVVLVGTSLTETTNNRPVRLKSFNRKVAEAVIPKIESYDPAYYPDEIARLVNERGFRRAYTGNITRIAHPKFQNAPDLKFMDILKSDKKDRFIVLLVDMNGVCYKILSGPGFAKND